MKVYDRGLQWPLSIKKGKREAFVDQERFQNLSAIRKQINIQIQFDVIKISSNRRNL